MGRRNKKLKEIRNFTRHAFDYIWLQQKYYTSAVTEKFADILNCSSNEKLEKTHFTESFGKAVCVTQYLLRDYFMHLFKFSTTEEITSFKKEVMLLCSHWLDNRNNNFVKVIEMMAMMAESFMYCECYMDLDLELNDITEWSVEWFVENLASDFFKCGGWERLNSSLSKWYIDMFDYLNQSVDVLYNPFHSDNVKSRYTCNIVSYLRRSPVQFPVPESVLCDNCRHTGDDNLYRKAIYIKLASDEPERRTTSTESTNNPICSPAEIRMKTKCDDQHKDDKRCLSPAIEEISNNINGSLTKQVEEVLKNPYTEVNKNTKTNVTIHQDLKNSVKNTCISSPIAQCPKKSPKTELSPDSLNKIPSSVFPNYLEQMYMAEYTPAKLISEKMSPMVEGISPSAESTFTKSMSEKTCSMAEQTFFIAESTPTTPMSEKTNSMEKQTFSIAQSTPTKPISENIRSMEEHTFPIAESTPTKPISENIRSMEEHTFPIAESTPTKQTREEIHPMRNFSNEPDSYVLLTANFPKSDPLHKCIYKLRKAVLRAVCQVERSSHRNRVYLISLKYCNSFSRMIKDFLNNSSRENVSKLNSLEVPKTALPEKGTSVVESSVSKELCFLKFVSYEYGYYFLGEKKFIRVTEV